MVCPAGLSTTTTTEMCLDHDRVLLNNSKDYTKRMLYTTGNKTFVFVLSYMRPCMQFLHFDKGEENIPDPFDHALYFFIRK